MIQRLIIISIKTPTGLKKRKEKKRNRQADSKIDKEKQKKQIKTILKEKNKFEEHIQFDYKLNYKAKLTNNSVLLA